MSEALFTGLGGTAPTFGSDEALLHRGGANRVLRFESVGGYLFLTSTRLVFRPHRINRQTGETSLPLGGIEEVRLAKMFWIIPNAVTVHFEGGAVEKFVVERRADWVESISRAVAELKRSRGASPA